MFRQVRERAVNVALRHRRHAPAWEHGLADELLGEFLEMKNGRVVLRREHRPLPAVQADGVQDELVEPFGLTGRGHPGDDVQRLRSQPDLLVHFAPARRQSAGGPAVGEVIVYLGCVLAKVGDASDRERGPVLNALP